MNNIFCPRCQSKFYTAMTGPELTCPFCGFSFNIAEPEKRVQRRAFIQRDCDLQREEVMVSAQTVDISKTGIGIKVMGSMPFKINDTLKVVVKDFEIDSSAQVVWIKTFDDVISRAGLRFC